MITSAIKNITPSELAKARDADETNMSRDKSRIIKKCEYIEDLFNSLGYEIKLKKSKR